MEHVALIVTTVAQLEAKGKWSQGQSPREIVMTAFYRSVGFNRISRTEPHGCIPVARGTPVHISGQESQNIQSIVAFV